ncbi:hypothetical protein OEZ85_012180 [Tetradesmus obliquus]|uniref:ABC transporter domain-containing protein n=1 Tax=Tetradesmus obliquus TaxID=3088 RepID=A0ABY8TWJ0_TETOB|nr:hypothetical protein OEZ85_012180 [Tetradesmus obliquus]
MVSLAYPTYVNIMLYGESGLGKTGKGFSAATAGAKTSLAAFRADPDSLRIQLAPIRDVTSNLEMHFSFQDMPGWAGAITERDLKLRYRPGLPLVLRRVSFEVSPGEKVSLVGRTGSP